MHRPHAERRGLRHALCALALLCACSAQAAEFDHTHKTWNKLLQESVVPLNEYKASAVRYNRLGSHGAQYALDWYLGALSAVPTSTYNDWTRAQQLAFLINAYNAYTVKLVLNHYPVNSLKDVVAPGADPWQREFFELLGRQRSLATLERDLIGAFEEPRVHFALSCAAIGCPMLRNEAYVAERLDEQLEDQVRRFMSDATRNRYDAQSNTARVSRIFEWHAKDFARSAGSVQAYIARYAEALTGAPDRGETLAAKPFRIDYLPYDWHLNDAR
ncbi:MAG TPA: DUF547 domain-containing protein [Burkholderiales bacterium]|nr:DUF547 domain-containing protein [Burkholderiales bacterium]